MRYRTLVVIVSLLATALASAQHSHWTPGQTGRLVDSDYQKAALAKTKEAIEVYILIRFASDRNDRLETDQELHSRVMQALEKFNKMLASGEIRTVNAGLPVGVMDVGTAGNIATLVDDPTYAKVKVQSGPLKGTIWFTTNFIGNSDLAEGEPVVLTSNRRKLAGAFAKHDLAQFYDAVDERDKSLATGMLTLGRVLTYTNGTKGVVDSVNGRYARIRISSGKHKGTLVYFLREELKVNYGGDKPIKAHHH